MLGDFLVALLQTVLVFLCGHLTAFWCVQRYPMYSMMAQSGVSYGVNRAYSAYKMCRKWIGYPVPEPPPPPPPAADLFGMLNSMMSAIMTPQPQQQRVVPQFGTERVVPNFRSIGRVAPFQTHQPTSIESENLRDLTDFVSNVDFNDVLEQAKEQCPKEPLQSCKVDCQERCRKECQIECQEKCKKECQIQCQEKCKKECQIKCQVEEQNPQVSEQPKVSDQPRRKTLKRPTIDENDVVPATTSIENQN